MSWHPTASLQVLRQRAEIIAQIRQFFTSRDYLEVETPIMGQYGITDVYLSNITATFRQQTYHLQTSPEYHMKRLLAAGSGPIFQICKSFRDDELGRWHNPEFTLLEWYKLSVNHHQLLDEVDLFLQTILATKPLVRKSYQEVFEEIGQINPFTCSIADFKILLQHYDLDNVLDDDEMDRDQYLFLLMSHIIEPTLKHSPVPVAVYDFPASQAALSVSDETIGARFEIYYQGIELANGFQELTDYTEQKERLEADVFHRSQKKLGDSKIDPYFLAALEAGLPSCSGVALGVDRLIALALKKSKLSEILSFDLSNA